MVLHIHGCVPFLPAATQRRPYSIALPMQPPHDSHQPRESCDVANEGGRAPTAGDGGPRVLDRIPIQNVHPAPAAVRLRQGPRSSAV